MAKRLAAVVILAGIVMIPVKARSGPPPPPPINVPGTLLGESRSRWVAPFVLQLVYGTVADSDTEGCCCSPAQGHVLWFGSDGKVEHEISGEVSLGFATGFSNSGATYFGLVPWWELRLEQGPRTSSGLVSASPTGGIFVHVTRPSDAEVAMDVYRTGRLLYRVSPFPATDWVNARPAESGACALSVTQTNEGYVVLLFDPTGKERLRIRNQGPVSATPAPDGQAMILSHGNGLILHTTKGERVILPAEPNCEAAGWSPDSRTLLAQSSYGHAKTYYLIQRDSGAILWSYQASTDQIDQHNDSAFLLPYVLIYGQQRPLSRGEGGTQHRIVALDAATGHVLGAWRSSLEGPGASPARLIPVQQQVYFVTDSRFSAINTTAIGARRDGWMDAATDSARDVSRPATHRKLTKTASDSTTASPQSQMKVEYGEPLPSLTVEDAGPVAIGEVQRFKAAAATFIGPNDSVNLRRGILTDHERWGMGERVEVVTALAESLEFTFSNTITNVFNVTVILDPSTAHMEGFVCRPLNADTRWPKPCWVDVDRVPRSIHDIGALKGRKLFQPHMNLDQIMLSSQMIPPLTAKEVVGRLLFIEWSARNRQAQGTPGTPAWIIEGGGLAMKPTWDRIPAGQYMTRQYVVLDDSKGKFLMGFDGP